MPKTLPVIFLLPNDHLTKMTGIAGLILLPPAYTLMQLNGLTPWLLYFLLLFSKSLPVVLDSLQYHRLLLLRLVAIVADPADLLLDPFDPTQQAHHEPHASFMPTPRHRKLSPSIFDDE